MIVVKHYSIAFSFFVTTDIKRLQILKVIENFSPFSVVLEIKI